MMTEFFVGGIFPEEFKATEVEIAFKYAVYSVNRERKLLGNSTLVHRTLFFKPNDVFQATKLGKQPNLLDLCVCIIIIFSL